MTTTEMSRGDALSSRIFLAGLEALELLNMELGLRLGLYQRLVDAGPLTSANVASAAGIDERYAREWLEQQAVAGIIDVIDAASDAEERTYAVAREVAAVLLDADNPANTTALTAFLAECGRMLPAVADAFRTGAGVPYADYAIHDPQAAFTRPVLVHQLVQEWLPALPDVHDRLLTGEPLHIAEIGCGEGVAAIMIAQAFPKVTVVGFDLDDASVAVARKQAADAGVAERVKIERWDVSQGAAQAPAPGPFDLVLAIEMLHDVPDPVAVLTTMRDLCAADGAVLVVDERAAEIFTAPGDEMERFFYAASVLHCLPVGMVEPGSAGTGTVIRPSVVRDYASRAGLRTTVLDVEHPQFRLYRLGT